ncbi:DUF1428 domain-containing protein [Microbulbifer sp. CnH-101-G]|uniref:DUF1428 domain-containing protein n=1 Tax=Microbulbifer sp. CnH-101-G TaxID=3243393 RepID=UPI0040397BD2
MQRLLAELFKEQGALKVMEIWGDDVPDGEVTSFPMAIKCTESETVVFSWTIWPSKEIRDAGWQDLVDAAKNAARGKPDAV